MSQDEGYEDWTVWGAPAGAVGMSRTHERLGRSAPQTASTASPGEVAMSARPRARWRTTTIGFTALALLSLLLAATAAAEAPGKEEAQPPTTRQELPLPEYAGAPTPRAMGGPDTFGYTFIDAAEPGGPVYTPIDISATGTLLVTGDDQTAPAPLGAPFSLYGQTYTTLHPTTNGVISTEADSSIDLSNDCPLPATPSTGTGKRVYPLHDDLVSDVYYQYFASSPVPHPRGLAMGASVFQWDAEYWGTADGTRDFSIWAILYDNGDMVFQVGAGTNNGATSTTGLQDETATRGLTIGCDAAGSIPDGYAVWITATPPACTATTGIENGSFETGDFTGWCTRDLGAPFDPLAVALDGTTGAWGFFASSATDGTFLARHGFDGGGPGTIALRQGIDLAGTVVRADLSFDWRAGWDLFAGPTLDRTLGLLIEPDGGGAPLAGFGIMSTDFATTTTVMDTGQQTATVDLSGFAGSRVVLSLSAAVPESFTGPATMDIDNVVLDLNHRPEVVTPLADLTVLEDAPDSSIGLSGVFADADGTPFALSLSNDNPALVTPAWGTGVLVLSYTANASGTATIELTATDPEGASVTDTFVVTVQPVNDRPVAVDDGPYTVEEGGTLTVNGVLDNDSDIDGGTLSAREATAPVNGTLTLAADGSFTYVHDHSDTTSDSFTYWANDGGADSELATVTIDVTPVGHTMGLVDPDQGRWHLTNEAGPVAPFFFGNPGDVPFMGDWDCDGIATPGLFRTSDAYAYLSNANTSQIADIRFFFGNPDDIPLAGDFDGDGCDTVSIYRAAEQRFYIMNELGADEGGLGAADYAFTFGNPGDKPVVGDWDDDGIDEVGLHRESTGFFYWRDSLSTGIADGTMFFGDPGDRFVAGDWGVVDGADTPAVFRPADRTCYFRYTLTQGNADKAVLFGEPPWLPVAGEFGLD